jgi:hypothetical protein
LPYLKLTNGVPENYSIGKLRRDNPNVSFPKQPSDALLADWDVYPYTVLPQPAYDSLVQRCAAAPLEQVEGRWVQAWTVEQLPLDQAEGNVRSRRDRLLEESDWTQVLDAPVDQAAWAAYRQALRDIPQQGGFPYTVTWPTAPEV